MTKKSLAWLFVSFLLALICTEIFARYFLGLGTPPLTVAHPTIEYMFKPNQNVDRFGHNFIVNQYGMRTLPFQPRKSKNETRIMVFGDSILNGGSMTGHASLATTLLQKNFDLPSGKLLVGNISAGTWGPGNWLAYAKEYGFFDADIIAIVVSSHDYFDNPTFEPLNEKTHPTKNPLSALTEGISRYLPRYLPKFEAQDIYSLPDHFPEFTTEPAALKGLGDLKALLQLAQQQSKNIIVLQHWEAKEVAAGSPQIGNKRIEALCRSLGITTVQLGPHFKDSMAQDMSPYNDNIHPSKMGHKIIANVLESSINNLPRYAIDSKLHGTLLTDYSLQTNQEMQIKFDGHHPSH